MPSKKFTTWLENPPPRVLWEDPFLGLGAFEVEWDVGYLVG